MLAAGAALLPVAAVAGWPLARAEPAQEQVLPVDQALQLQPAIWQDGALVIGIDLCGNCYLYRDRFSVEPVKPAGVILGQPELPPTQAHADEHFGEVRIWRDRLVARYPRSDPKKGQAGPRPVLQQVRVRYQGCAENLVCYPPQDRVIDVEAVR